MGLLSGLVAGFSEAGEAARQETLAANEAQLERERSIFQLLLQAPGEENQDIRDAALAGLLTPPEERAKKKGGVSGAIGNLFNIPGTDIDPRLIAIRQMTQAPVETTREVPGGGETVAFPPGGSISAADPGPPGPRPVQPGIQLPATQQQATEGARTVTETGPRPGFPGLLTEADIQRQRIEGRQAGFEELPDVSPGLASRATIAASGGAALFSGTGAPTGFAGEVRGDQLVPGTLDVSGRPVEEGQLYRRQFINGEPALFPVASDSRSAGSATERAAQEAGYARFSDAPVSERPAIIQRGIELDAQAAGTETGARAAATAGGVPFKAARTRELRNEWDAEREATRTMQEQFRLMEVGLRRARAGDGVGGSQAVLVTFQRILDPDSVVRESEYARSAAGLTILARIEGMRQRLFATGGAGVPPDELAGMVETARQFLEATRAGSEGVRARTQATIDTLGLEAREIFAAEPLDPTGPPPGTGTSGGALRGFLDRQPG